jgi:hypothetical protein
MLVQTIIEHGLGRVQVILFRSFRLGCWPRKWGTEWIYIIGPLYDVLKVSDYIALEQCYQATPSQYSDEKIDYLSPITNITKHDRRPRTENGFVGALPAAIV